MVLMCFIPLQLQAYDFEVDGIGYTVTSRPNLTCEVSELVNNDLIDVIIPDKVIFRDTELTVTSIGRFAFSAESNIHSVYIPSTIQSLGDYMCSSCENLFSVKFQEGCSLDCISAGAFKNCYALRTINFPAPKFHEFTIQPEAFSHCTSLDCIILPETSCDIGESAFEYSGLSTVITPDNLPITIYDCAFSNCELLKEINLKNAQFYGSHIFRGCNNLESVEIGSCAIPQSTFIDCTNLKQVSLLEGVEYISMDAFMNSGVENIILPYSLKKLGSYAFADCKNLRELTISGPYVNCDGNDIFRNSPIEKLTILSVQSSKQFFGYTRSQPPFTTAKYLYTNGISKQNLLDRNSIPFPALDILELGPDTQSILFLKWDILNLQKLICHASTPPELPKLTNQAYLNWEVIVPENCLGAYRQAPVWQEFWNIKGDSTANSIEDVNITTDGKRIVAKYSIDGVPVDDNYKGIIILRYSDGSSKKHFQR